MALPIQGINSGNVLFQPQKTAYQNKPDVPAGFPSAATGNQLDISAMKNPTELILQSAMEKINEVFAPYLGDGAVGQAVESGMDMSPEATAERILSFATQLIGRVEGEQADLPVEEQRSREQLFNNLQSGIEKGFEQARGILEGLQALNGDVKETVDNTYDLVQQGLNELSLLLGLLPDGKTEA